MSQLLEEILSRENMMRAYKRVVANKGASGVDGITTEEVKEYLIEHWEEIREQIRNRKYKPQPVRRVEIPKPNGGVRNLGIPSVVDRIIEQAIAQKLTPIVEPLFSEYSYGFRPKRRAQQAVIKLLEYLSAEHSRQSSNCLNTSMTDTHISWTSTSKSSSTMSHRTNSCTLYTE